MPGYHPPGVYIDEQRHQVYPISAADTSVALFIGHTTKGPQNNSVLIGQHGLRTLPVNSWNDYVAAYGGISKNSETVTASNGSTVKLADQMGHSVAAFFNNGGSQAYIIRVADRRNTTTGINEYNLQDYQSIFTALENVHSVNIICLPGLHYTLQQTMSTIIREAVSHCSKMGDRLVLIDPPPAFPLAQQNDVAHINLPPTSYAAFYYPWVTIPNPQAATDKHAPKIVTIAPSGFAAGIWARTDQARGVWKAPAGTEAQLVGASGFEYVIDNTQQDKLNPLGINCLRTFPARGRLIWGARTLASESNSEWRYLSVRRTAIMIEQSIIRGTEWIDFEPNAHPLWSTLINSVNSFMQTLFREGAFAGNTARDAYFVKCGLGDTMTQTDIDNGQLILTAGFAAVKPAEFIIINIRRKLTR